MDIPTTIKQASSKKTAPPVKTARVLIAFLAITLLTFLFYKAYEIYGVSVDKLYRQTYLPFEVTDTANSLSPIEERYLLKDYKGVVRQSKRAMTLSDQERLLIGLSYLEQKEYLPAISWFNPIVADKENKYQPTAEFYLTLTHLINGDYDRCLELMRPIAANTAHPYHQQFTQKTVQQVRLLKWQ